MRADLGSGLYHFGVDNYGDKDTPLFGSQIAAFQGETLRPLHAHESTVNLQCWHCYRLINHSSLTWLPAAGHHQRPWTITQREFCNNCSLTFKPAGSAAALLLALSAAGLTSSQWDIFAATAIFFIAMSQQFHAWSHMRPSQLPAAVIALQDANVIISRKAHGTHHRSPFSAPLSTLCQAVPPPASTRSHNAHPPAAQSSKAPPDYRCAHWQQLRRRPPSSPGCGALATTMHP